MMMEKYSNLKEEVGGSIPGCEISSLPGGKLAMWSTTSYAIIIIIILQANIHKITINFTCVWIL